MGMRPSIVALWLLVACREAPPVPARVFSADFEACVKLEGAPEFNDHSKLTKCLVDRFRWTVTQADRGADSTIRLFNQSMDSARSLAEADRRQQEMAWDSTQQAIRQAVASEEARRAKGQRRINDSIAVSTGKTSIVGDRETKLYYSNNDVLCKPLRSVPQERRVYFANFLSADAAGYRESPRCPIEPTYLEGE